jgi:hypothetical protein
MTSPMIGRRRREAPRPPQSDEITRLQGDLYAERMTNAALRDDLAEAVAFLRACGPASNPRAWHRLMARIAPSTTTSPRSARFRTWHGGDGVDP